MFDRGNYRRSSPPSRLTLQRSEASKLSGSLLPRLSCDRIAALVVLEDILQTHRFRGAPAASEIRPTHQHQGTAHLFQRHLRIFSPAAAGCAATRRSALPDTTLNDVSTRHNSVPRSASARLPLWPRETHVPRSSARRPQPAPVAPRSLPVCW